jgi:hypothetical protein
MAIDALVGGLAGAVVRAVPEVMKFFDRKQERKHELALGEQQFNLVKLQENTKLETATVETQASQFTQAVGALQAAYNGQKSGVAWADAVSSTVRPAVTYGFAAAYLIQKMHQGTWDATDTAIFSGILNFWFMGRVFDKATR